MLILLCLLAVTAASKEAINNGSDVLMTSVTLDEDINHEETLETLRALKYLIPIMKGQFEQEAANILEDSGSDVRKLHFDRSDLFGSADSSDSSSSSSSKSSKSSKSKKSSESSKSKKSSDVSHSPVSTSKHKYSSASSSSEEPQSKSHSTHYASHSVSSKYTPYSHETKEKSSQQYYSESSSPMMFSPESYYSSEYQDYSPYKSKEPSESKSKKSSEESKPKKPKKSNESKKSQVSAESSSSSSSSSVSNHHYERSGSGSIEEHHIHHDHTYVKPGAVTFNPVLKQCCKDILEALDECEQIIEQNIKKIMVNHGVMEMNKQKAAHFLDVNYKNKALITSNAFSSQQERSLVASQEELIETMLSQIKKVYNLATTARG